MRQLVLDTETTGIDPKQGHRIIEIGAVELIDRKLTGNHYHVYLQPDREIEAEAIEVHGITNEFLIGKQRFSEVADEFVDFCRGAELVIHNAPFDVGFINHELVLNKNKVKDINECCGVLDTLKLARQMYPGQRASLDALCKRLGIDNSHRTLHGALLDSEILADVYLLMTGGQTDLGLSMSGGDESRQVFFQSEASESASPIKVIKATEEEQAAHQLWVDRLGEDCRWTALLK